MPAAAPSHNLRFAAFEVDLRNGELRKHGVRIKLQDQPFQVLAMLLATPGDIVTREELRAKLWPGDTFVDFDTGLNTAVKRLRDALGDTAGSPRYVETLPRKGYRFIYPIDDSQAATMPAQADPAAPVPDPRGFPRFARVIIPVLLLAMVGVVFAGFRFLRPHPALSDQDVIVLADFDNRTGEPVFDDTLKQALAIDLRQSPFLSLLSDLRTSETLKMMRRAPGERITPEMGREICLRTSSKALLAGSIASLGSHYALQLKASNCQTGETLAADQAEADSREKVLRALDEAATRLRSELGESLASVRKYDRPLEEVTTSSLEALQAYSEGARAWDREGDAAAIPFLKRAVELDPNFAAAYNLLHFCYENLGNSSLALENMRRAYSLRERLIEPEKYFISGWYYSSVTGEIPKAIEQFHVLVQEYPKHGSVHGALGNQYDHLGQYEKAAAEYREQVRLFPSDILGYELVADYIALNRLEEAQAVLNQGLSRIPEHPFLHYFSYDLAFIRNEPTGMQKELDAAKGKPAEFLVLRYDADTQAYHGRLAKSIQVRKADSDLAQRQGALEPISMLHTVNAVIEAEFGYQAQARQSARAALALPCGRWEHETAAWALASSGDLVGAQQQLDALNHEYPLDTVLQNYWAPTIRARIEMARGHPKAALEILQLAAPYDLSDFGAMYPVFVRGQAYIASGEGSAAAAEFQKILDHRGLVLNDAVGALAHLYLGRARVLEARSLEDKTAEDASAKARAAYQDFFSLWKDADPDIPILRQAKAEYAKLR